MTYHQPITTCSRMANTCPSKKNCHRHEISRSMEYPDAALNVRREKGSTACDMVIWIEPPATTFVEE